jgi:hypothetical protein
MKKIEIISSIMNSKILVATLAALLLFGCQREEEDLPLATFPKTPEVFTDNFVGLGSDFYFPYADAKPDVFSVDETEGFESNASIRIDVPSSSDPGGSYAGAIFRIDGAGRNLTDYNALTFYAKASQGATVAQMGFGQDFLGDTYVATISNVQITTNWRQYVIPIPDPSKLISERGVFNFSAAGIGEEGNTVGYSMWIDEIRFENLPTVAQPLPQIFNGNQQVESSFTGVTIPVAGANVLYNVDGTDVPVNAAPAYFNFTSTDNSVASVNEFGLVTVNSAGTATITASIGTGDNIIEAEGALIVNSAGAFTSAPTPPARSAQDVVSIFSDVYENVTVDNYNGFFQFATTQGGAINIAGDNIISYTELNFVSINMFNSPDVDASAMTHVHIDINVREAVSGGDFIRLQLINNNGPTETSGAVNLGDYSPLLQDQWVSYDIPLSDFTGLSGTDDIDLIFFVSDGTIRSIYVDNVYFYRQ